MRGGGQRVARLEGSAWRRWKRSIVALGIVLACALGQAPHVRDKVPIVFPSPSPEISGGSVSLSTNWSGYVATGHKGYYTEIRAQWREPALTCSPSLSPKNDDAFWIGIDGFADSTVEQTGTEGVCEKKRTTYHAWYETFPKPPVIVFRIDAGDRMAADITWEGNRQYTITLSDLTSGRKSQRLLTTGPTLRSSAEWIAETSNLCKRCLEDFGTVRFTGAAATTNGQSHAIGGLPNKRVTMVAPGKKGAVMAQASALSSSGNAFSVYWKSSGG